VERKEELTNGMQEYHFPTRLILWFRLLFCTCTLYATFNGSFLALSHWMLRSRIFFSTRAHAWRKGPGRSLPLANLMLRSRIFFCTCTLGAMFKIVLALAHFILRSRIFSCLCTLDALSQDLSLHLPTPLMLHSRIFSCTCAHFVLCSRIFLCACPRA
jgi:hypothetical protein